MVNFRRILQLIFIVSIANLQIVVSQEYVARVTAYPENGPFRSRQLVPLKCTVSPTPRFPVVYIWRSSTPNYYPEDSFPSTTPITTITISENHPLNGRYFCHVLLANNRTTLAVGHVDIQVKGLLRPIGSTEVTITPPSSLQFMVGLTPEYSRRKLFDSFSNITYEWRHNDSILDGHTRGDASRVRQININGNRLAIPRTRSTNAGTYSSRINSFGFKNYANMTCAMIVLQALRNYAIFQPVEFQAISGPGLASPMKSTSMITNVHFTSEIPFEVNVNVPLNPIGDIDFSQDSHKFALELKAFYNGEKLNPYINTEVRRPRDFYSSFVLLTEERAVQVTLELPYPVPDDEGLYELQLFLKLNDVNLGFSPNCSDYLEFLDSYDGLKLPTLLVGSATLMLHQYGAPQVVVTATQQTLPAGGTESLPILTCSVVENESLQLLNQLRWVKGDKEVARTEDSGTITFDTASIVSTSPEESHFGTYRCEAFSSQDETEESIHIAERAQFSMQLQSLNNDISCRDIREDVKQSLLNILRMELEFSLSSAGDGDISSNNFVNPSLTCSSDGNNVVVMSTDIVYSNRNGSVTASALVEMAEEWMNGIRTANGFAFQINRPGANISNFTLDAGQLVGIVILCLVSVLLFIVVITLVTCLILRHRNRSQTLKQGLPQVCEIPLNTDSTPNHSSMNAGSAPIAAPLEGQSSHMPITESGNQLLHGSHSSSQTSSSHYGSLSIHNEARLLLNAGTQSEVDTSSLTCTPNCAYNRMQDVGGMNLQIQTRNPVSNSRQISVQYDYPELQFTAADSCKESMETSDAYDVITTMT